MLFLDVECFAVMAALKEALEAVEVLPQQNDEPLTKHNGHKVIGTHEEVQAL